MGKIIKTVIASVLKPVDDPRMYEKLGLSLQQTNRYEVNIIGFKSKKIPEDPNIHFHPLYNFPRNSIFRLLASFPFLILLTRLKPKLLIVSTYELLPAALLYRCIFRRTHLIYDVQENYALNLLSNHRLNTKARLLAYVVRQVEKRAQPSISLNLLAEKNYAKELSFIRKKLILLNKFKVPGRWCTMVNTSMKAEKDSCVDYPVLIFCGTISTDYGAKQSINLVKELAKYFPMLKAKFIGHVPECNLLKKLKAIQNPLFSFHIHSNPIPHKHILEVMSKADFGMVAHQPTPSIRNCFPTRIYEFMHYRIPILLQAHPYWVHYCQRWNACIPLDYNHFDAGKIAEQMQTLKFYSNGKPDDIYWESEEEKLIKATNQLFFVNS